MPLNLNDEDRRMLRRELAEAWYLTEKAIERLAGMVLIFAGAAILVAQEPADMIDALIVALALSGGFTYIFLSRRTRAERPTLTFVTRRLLSKRILYSALGAVGTWFAFREVMRLSLWSLVGFFVALAAWYIWRYRQLMVYEMLFDKTDKDSPNESDTVNL